MKSRNTMRFEYIAAAGFASWVLLAHGLDIAVGQRMGDQFIIFSREMICMIPCIFILIGLLDVWIPGHWIQKHIGEESGFRGALFAVLLAMIQGGPLYGAFPIAHLLRKKGCSMRNVFIYLGAFSTLKIPMVLFEVSFLGWKFTLVRATVALPVFALIAVAMAAYMRRAGLQMREISEDEDTGR